MKSICLLILDFINPFVPEYFKCIFVMCIKKSTICDPYWKVEVLHPDKECVEVGGGGQLHDGLLHHKDEADHLQVRQLFKVVSHINRFEIFNTIQKMAWHLCANERDRDRFCILFWWVICKNIYLDYAWRSGEIWIFWKHRFLSPCTLCPWIVSPSVSPARVRG